MRVKQMTTMELGIHDVLTGIAAENDTAAFWRVLFSNEWKAVDNSRAGDNDVLIGIGDDRHSYVLTSLFSNEWKADDNGRVGGSWDSQTTTLLRFDRE